MTTISDTDYLSNLRALYNRARTWKRNRYERWTRNYRLVHNQLGGTASETWMPAPRSSEIYPILSNRIAWMADQGINITAGAAVDPGSPFADFAQKLAQDLSTVMLSIWTNFNWEQQIKLALWDDAQYGIGLFKSLWDDTLDGGLGNVSFKRVDPWTFYTDQNATNLDDAEYLIEVRRMTMDEIERRFPGGTLNIEARNFGAPDYDQRPQLTMDAPQQPMLNLASPPGGDRMGLVQNRTHTADSKNEVVVYEFWTKENDTYFDEDQASPTYSEQKIHPIWRVTVVAQGEILLDEKATDLWSHGMHPYSRFVSEDVGELYGVALVDHLAYPQIYLNRILTAYQMNLELTGNPILIESEAAGTTRLNLSNKPGTRVPIKGTAGMQNKPEWLQPPSMPTSTTELMKFWIDRMENVAGITASMKGASDGGGARVAQGVMSSIQESAFVRIRTAQSNLESSLEDAGRKVADLIIENYTEPRFVSITGPQGEQSSLALGMRHFNTPSDEGSTPLKYMLKIDAGSEMPTSLAARSAREEKLYLMGATDREALLKGINYPNRAEVIERINKAIAAGTFSPPGKRQRAQRSQ